MPSADFLNRFWLGFSLDWTVKLPGVRSVILEKYFKGSLSPAFPVEMIITFSEVDVGIFVVFFRSVFCCWIIMSIVLAWSSSLSSITSGLSDGVQLISGGRDPLV